MSVLQRVVVMAMSRAYAHARQIGYTADDAADEALMVARFIRDTMDDNIVDLRWCR